MINAIALPVMSSSSMSRNANPTRKVCQDCVLRKASLASGARYIPCFIHDLQADRGSLVASDLIFSFGGEGGFYFYSPQYQITST